MGSKAIKMADGIAWVRRGLPGLSVEKQGVTIEIDDELLRHLMAETMRNRLISRLEQMTTNEIFTYFKIEG